MAIVASAHVLLAGPLLPAVPSVIRVIEPAPVSGMEEVAETTVVPPLAEVITTVQLPVEAPHVYLHAVDPTKLPLPPVTPAFAVPLPTVVPTAVTVMVSV